MLGGCCGACASAANKVDQEEAIEAAERLGMGQRCKENGAFEKLITLGPEHCAK